MVVTIKSVIPERMLVYTRDGISVYLLNQYIGTFLNIGYRSLIP